ncbi:ribonuclease D [Rheinheimera sp. UJ63]|uniref:ribonuclease D n=1 Tax=Rheinheimera sp. UJ63 TaxID=2910157 RepID=UPI001F2A3112|nr:ribonuclease D [Rheinheimera sp. UJ63]MCF4007917.1 ribonuclease D [Rheinheimera sp. UJ63]
MSLLSDNQSLARFCLQAAEQPSLAVDTEFIRQSTLSPKLGLIQLFDGQHFALVDPLAIDDWTPLQTLFAAPHICKILHSCTEDLEAFATINITQITPLFDTQLAAEVIGWGGSIGYARLVEQITGAVIDKSEARTDWLARPLAPAQLAYAANDVKYLLDVYQRLLTEFKTPQQLEVLLAEGQQLLQRRQHQLPDQFKFLEIKNSTQLNSRELAVLRDIVSWRFQYASSKDLALGLVAKDAQLLELAKRRPATPESLLNIPGMATRDMRRHAKLLVELIQQAKALAPEQCPQRFYHLDRFAGEKVVLAELGQAVKDAAASSGLPAAFLSTRRQLHEFFNWCWRVSDEQRAQLPIPEYLRGWRAELLKPFLPKPAHVDF